MRQVEYRINSQNDTVELILLAFKELSIGIGISALCDIEILRGDYSSTIVLTNKSEKEFKHSDFFWFGYFVGRDFEEKECEKCKTKKIAVLKKIKSKKQNKCQN
ncbi:hypothetical protein OK18_19185 [Chryseobacterium gallinarum]|uniref:Uncharacterized protein n=1 Tax=Chryseobacterium gallinarum TaxID=1324352 RepID=A0A0G3M5K6_CHRGL|nr:hypothetical protein [Chryseobacterium gallinarum]AKK74456.1 hypothetical protein OK18_19185 [Chryseobacterium gallinarum]